MKVAIYVRVSTEDQTLEQQQKPLIDFCIQNKLEYDLFGEYISGAKASRPQLDLLMQGIRAKKYNKVLVYKLDRLGRSLKHLIQLVEEFNNKDVQFICMNPNFDTKTASGRFFIQIIGAVAELEREMISERTKAKLYLLKSKGQKLGRPKGSKDIKGRRKSGYYMRHLKSKQTTPLNNEVLIV